MDDIAKHAGVSRATVSYVLNKRTRSNGTISDETCQRVLAAAAALNYRTNELAKAVVTGKNRILGLLTTPSSAENAIKIITGAIDAAEKKEYLLKIMHLSYDEVGEDVIARCKKWQLAGVIAFNFNDSPMKSLYHQFAQVGMPIVLIDAVSYITKWGATIRSDDAHGIGLAVSHLQEQGHTRIGFVGGDPSLLTQRREETFRSVLTAAGLSIRSDWIRQSSWFHRGRMQEAAHALLHDAIDRPTAIICSSDIIAMVVINVADSLGMHVPTDLSMIGYSNQTFGDYMKPLLTTIEQPFYEMGRLAAQQAISFAENFSADSSSDVYENDGYATPINTLLPTRLIERASTAPPPW